MKLKFLGVRGSRPTHKTGLLGFGGNSTSMEFVFDDSDFRLFLDGGSGIAHLGMELGPQTDIKKFYFLVTHTHWDHVLGYPYFEPLYNVGNEVTFYASKTSRNTFHELFFGLQSEAHLPIPSEQLKAKTSFVTAQAGENYTIEDKVTVKTYQINHQGITLSYRVESEGNSVAVVTDHAPIEDGNYLGEGMKERALENPESFEADFNDGLVEFLRDCHTVVFDTHFTSENLKPDWGHSTPQLALEVCARAQVKRLILFHHAPEDLDSDVVAKVESVLESGRLESVDVVPAREGDQWTLKCG